jgi:hypothetical protein
LHERASMIRYAYSACLVHKRNNCTVLYAWCYYATLYLFALLT